MRETAKEGKSPMQQSREPFVEPEIVKHEEKVADVTTSTSGTGDLIGDAS
jgi:hypothetical protein